MRMDRVLRVAPLLAGMMIMACGPADDADLDTMPGAEVPGVPETDLPTTEPTAMESTAMFEPGPAGANVSGMVRIIPSDEELRLEVQLNGLTEGEHAWHIHNAPCGEEGPIVVAITPTADHPEGVGDPIEAGADGSAEADVTIPRDRIPPGLQNVLGTSGMVGQPGAATGQADTAAQATGAQGDQFSLHVHERAGVDHGQTVACADLGQNNMGQTGTTPPTTGADTGGIR